MGEKICQGKTLGMGWFLAIVYHWHHSGEPGIRDDGTEAFGEKGAWELPTQARISAFLESDSISWCRLAHGNDTSQHAPGQKNNHTSQHALAKGTTPLQHAGNFENHSQYALGPKHHSKNYTSQHTLDTIPEQILMPRTKLSPKDSDPQHN